MLFEIVPTGWSVPFAAGIVVFVGIQAGKITLPIVPMLVFVLLGLLPAFAVLMAAWKCAQKKNRPFLSFGAGPANSNNFFDGASPRHERPSNTASPASAPTRDTRPWTRADSAPKPASGAPPAPIPAKTVPEWNLKLLSELEWRRFELLVEGLFRYQGDWRAEGGPAGADGGVDIFLFRPGESRPAAAIQCKAYRTQQVGVNVLRELYGVMAAETIPHGMVVTCGVFSADARAFAADKPIDLIDGARLIELLGDLPGGARESLLREITAGDYTTPTCPKCRIKLVRRKSARGEFWGCSNYPGCRTVINGA